MIEDFKKVLNDKALVIGFERTIKLLRQGKAKKVFLAKNAPAFIKRDVLKYASGVKIDELEMTNEELGMLCKKPYKISVVSI